MVGLVLGCIEAKFCKRNALELGSIWKEDREKGDDWKKKIWILLRPRHYCTWSRLALLFLLDLSLFHRVCSTSHCVLFCLSISMYLMFLYFHLHENPLFRLVSFWSWARCRPLTAAPAGPEPADKPPKRSRSVVLGSSLPVCSSWTTCETLGVELRS